jgi:hypothetical protein
MNVFSPGRGPISLAFPEDGAVMGSYASQFCISLHRSIALSMGVLLQSKESYDESCETPAKLLTPHDDIS